MKQLLNRYRAWANKEPPTREQAYWAVVLPWLATGLLWAFTAVSWQQLGSIAITAVFAVTAAAITIGLYQADRKQGYADAIHKHRLERREKWLSEMKLTKE